MKITPEHYETLAELTSGVLARHDLGYLHESYELGKFARSEAVEDLNMRFRWDVLNASPHSTRFICDELYPYLNQDHIDTALRNIIAPTLVRRF